MDNTTYSGILKFLSTDSQPSAELEKYRTQARRYLVKSGTLYRRISSKHSAVKEALQVIPQHQLEALLRHLHDDPLGGHLGATAIEGKVRENYWWPNYIANIREYVKTCEKCQLKGKPRRNQSLNPIEVTAPFEHIGIDAVGPLPMTKNGNRYLLVAMDYFSKWPFAKAVPDITAETTAKFLHEEIICEHGCFKQLTSDRGTNFTANIIRELCKRLKIRHTFTSAYHPQANGLVERFNRTLTSMLGKFANEFHADWDEYVSDVLFAYRTTRHSTTKYSPFYLTYGRKPILPIDVEYLPEEIDKEDSDTLLDRTYEIIKTTQTNEQVLQNIKKAQEQYKERYDEGITLEDYKIGDKVLKHIGAYTHRKDVKFHNPWTGPYYIHNILNEKGTYQLRRVEDGKVIASPVHGNNLKRYYERSRWEPIIIIDTPPPF